jgi:hypothetical protein
VGRLWTSYEDSWLKQEYKAEMPIEVIAHALNRTVSAIKNRVKALDIQRPNYDWTEDEIARLKVMWPNLEIPVETIAHILGRTVMACQRMASIVRIKRPYTGSPEHLAQLKIASDKANEVYNGTPEALENLEQARGMNWYIGSPEHMAHMQELTSSPENIAMRERNIKMMNEIYRGSPAQEEHLKKIHDMPPAKGIGWGKGSYCLKGHWVRSTWERWYADFLFRNGISYEYEPEKFNLGMWRGHTLNYRPDFFLPSINCWVEVKGWMSERVEEQIRRFREAGNRLLVMRRIIRIPTIRKQIAAIRLTIDEPDN